ncbi:MAG: Octanoyltransferase LipM [Chlamydiae bacterium]|nr:Octanoyltransferase LipM [Chlamydiota bacterium]
MWKILDTGTASAEQNMAIDAELLENLSPDDPPLLHFYDWEGDSATYGYFLSPSKLLNLEGARARGLSLARRPTGGGVVFHLSDLAFSILLPAHSPHFSLNTLDNYNFINSGVKRAVKTFLEKPSLLLEEPLPFDESCRHFCMAKPTKYDVMGEDGRKIAGAAQRRRKEGYLHQGSISIALPKEDFLDAVLLPGTQVREAMFQNTFSILGSGWTPADLQEVRETLKHQLQKEFTQ